MRRLDTSQVGDEAEAEAERLLTERGWSVTNLNSIRRNHRLHDLEATKGDRTLRISVKHARAKRQVRLGNPNIFEELGDEDIVMIFMPPAQRMETDIAREVYELWIVPGHARNVPWRAHLHYYGGDEGVARSQTSMMIKDKADAVGGRSISGAAFREWSRYKNNWSLLD